MWDSQLDLKFIIIMTHVNISVLTESGIINAVSFTRRISPMS